MGTTRKRLDELTHAVLVIGDSLQRLVMLSETMLGIRTAPEAGNAMLPTPAPRSVGCSAGSENGTGEGVVDLSQEDVISFAQAAELIPTEPHPSASTISRWCSQGCRKTKLESFYIGGRRKTTRQAVGRFLAACRAQGWAGMHDHTAFHLEHAMAVKELLDD